MKRQRLDYQSVGITLRRDILEGMDGLAAEAGLSRSEVISDILGYAFENSESVMDEIYPSEEDGKEQRTPSDDEGQEEEDRD